MAKQLGGTIKITSHVGKGTKVRIYLPSAAVTEMPSARDPEETANLRASGTVLVVDDDSEVRAVASTWACRNLGSA